MDHFNFDGVVVELHDWIRADEGDGDPKPAFAKKLAQTAKFMGCNKASYQDGKDEIYFFTKPNGKNISIKAGHDLFPPSGWINFEPED